MSSKPLKTILYAEDEDDIRVIAKIALEDLGGFQVIYCNDGQHVLETALQVTPDILLLDVMMPRLDGPTTLSRLRQIPGYETIPAIFMTAKIQPEEIHAYHSLGAIDIIAKPFDPIALPETIKKAWTTHYGR